jgi:aspartokinase
MALIVRKYGGSSLSSIDKIKTIAQKIQALYNTGDQIVCVLSAMGETTDELLESALAITKNPEPRELDMLLSIGERRSISLMAIALNALNVPSISLTGSQIGLITTNQFGNARILEIKADRLKQELAKKKVVIIAGYQGVSETKEITTLGRGGTDLTAVAIAAVLSADKCELMKDVDGLFSVSPILWKDTIIRSTLSYEELEEIAESGTELLAKQAIEIAKHYKVKLAIGNSLTDYIGTIVSDKTMLLEGITQIIAKNVYISDLEEHNNPYVQTFHLHNQIIHINLDPNIQEKNAVYLSIFGYDLYKFEIFKFFYHDKMLFKNNNRMHFIFDMQSFNSEKVTIENILKAHLTKGRRNDIQN